MAGRCGKGDRVPALDEISPNKLSDLLITLFRLDVEGMSIINVEWNLQIAQFISIFNSSGDLFILFKRCTYILSDDTHKERFVKKRIYGK